MRSNRTHRLSVTAVIAFTGPVMAAALLGCGAPTSESEQSAPVTTSVEVHAAPTGGRWQRFQGVELPVTDQGPRSDEGAVVSGFERSPAGAAVAAAQASARISVATDSQWPQVGADMVAPGPGRDAWSVARAQLSVTAPLDADTAPRLLGYVLTRYSPEAAELDLYAQHPDRSITGHHTSVVWQHDDWRLSLPDPATSAPPTVTTLDTPPAELVAFAAR